MAENRIPPYDLDDLPGRQVWCGQQRYFVRTDRVFTGTYWLLGRGCCVVERASERNVTGELLAAILGAPQVNSDHDWLSEDRANTIAKIANFPSGHAALITDFRGRLRAKKWGRAG